MKKILTIAVTALLSTIAGAAHAQTPVNFPGTVTSACTLSAPVNGTLVENATPATGLNTGTPASVTVTCNGATSLDIATGTFTYPSQTPAPLAPVIGFTAGTGVFALSSGVTASLDTPTGNTGDIARINAVVTAAPTKLLKAGPYTVVVNATITP
jgi:hypothetical protein